MNKSSSSTSVNSNSNLNRMGSVLLVSYNDREFFSLVEKNRGAYVLDGRVKGWSRNENLRSDALKARFGKRYSLMPKLAIEMDEYAGDYMEKAAPVLARILEVLEKGRSVIITAANSGLLKCIGHMLMINARPELKVFLKWSNKTDSGMSRQKPMSDEEFVAKLKGLCDALQGFNADDDVADGFNDFDDCEAFDDFEKFAE